MTAKWPLDHKVIVQHQVVASKDVFGNVMTGWGPDETVRVFGWSEPSEEELVTAENAGRVVWDINLIAPSGTVQLTDQVIINGKKFTVEKISNYDNGPKSWLTPGLEVIQLKNVKG